MKATQLLHNLGQRIWLDNTPRDLLDSGTQVLAQRTIPELEGEARPKLEHASSTNNLIRRYRKLKESAE